MNAKLCADNAYDTSNLAIVQRLVCNAASRSRLLW